MNELSPKSETAKSSELKDDLNTQNRDRAMTVGKAVLGAVPFAGPLLTEIMTSVVPGLKTDRLIKYVRQIDSRIEALEKFHKQRVRNDPHSLELIEDGALEATRATSDIRIEQIAELVARGFERDKALDIRRKRILRVFSQIDDDEVLILNAYGHSAAFGIKNPEIRKDAWEKVKKPEQLSFNKKLSREQLDAQPLYDMGVANLRSLGLLKLQPKNVRRGEQMQFDKKTGEPIGNIVITRLGYILLNEIGLLSDDHHYLRN